MDAFTLLHTERASVLLSHTDLSLEARLSVLRSKRIADLCALREQVRRLQMQADSMADNIARRQEDSDERDQVLAFMFGEYLSDSGMIHIDK